MSDEKASPKAEIQGPKLGVTRPDSEDQFIDVGLRISDTGLRTLFLASSNPGKLREFRAAAAARGITVEELPSFANITPCIENGSTFAENARKKAIHYSRNCPVGSSLTTRASVWTHLTAHPGCTPRASPAPKPLTRRTTSNC